VLAVGVTLAGGGRARRVDGVIEASGGRFGRWMDQRTRVLAITVGHVVIGTDDDTLAVWRRHEHAHVAQYERWGVLMPALYAASSWRALRRGDSSYRANAFEREARIVARRGAVPARSRRSPKLGAYTRRHDLQPDVTPDARDA
jgi:hypothetical protein